MKIKKMLKNMFKSKGFIFREDIENIVNTPILKQDKPILEEINRIYNIFNLYDEKINYIAEEISELKSIRKNDNKKTVNDIYKIEKSFFDIYQCFEFKFYQNNIALNTILYDIEIEMNKIKGNVRSNFNPKISIIIPVYNGSNYLKEAIESAINQTYNNIEIIVINDGSNDDDKTEKIALSYKDKVKYFYKKNGGVSSALNFGIEKMTGEYFAWLSHDDIYYKNNIEEHINYLKNTIDSNVITYTCFDFIDEKSCLIPINTIFASSSMSDYKMSITKKWYNILSGEINGCSVLIPKEAFLEFGLFNESERITQEKDMWARLMKKYRFINIPINTTAIRCHNERVTKKNNNIREETDKKLIEILNNISINEINEEYGSKEAFYLMLLKNYYYNRINSLEKNIKSRLEDCRNEKK